jgi:uncharacterized protein
LFAAGAGNPASGRIDGPLIAGARRTKLLLGRGARSTATQGEPVMKDVDENTRTELEAAVFRRLVEHLRTRTDVQNIDMMNLAGFCRNCLSNWLKDAADERGLAVSKDETREHVYGMPYDEWKARHQASATPEQQAAFERNKPQH